MPSTERWLIRHVTVAGAALDCRIRDGRIAELAPSLPPGPGEAIIDGHHGALLPGLADHHIHLRALAAARRSIDLAGGPVESARDAPGNTLLRVIGAPTELTRTDLDRIWPDRPVRVQHRSGALWTLNSAALNLLDELTDDERATGQFWRAASRSRVLTPLRGDDTALADVSAELAANGITHLTDATPDADPGSLAVRQHVLSLAEQGHGPRKIVIPDHEPTDFDALVNTVRAAHRAGRGVALHAVTAAALAFAIAAVTEAGSHEQDRIEHAAVCDDDAARRIAELGATIVTQPTLFARHHRAYLRDSEPADRDRLWRYGSLLRLGVRVAISSDAPYGDANPWESIRAAATRMPPTGDDQLGPSTEHVPAPTALATMLTRPDDPAGLPRRIAPGELADLCLLATDLATALHTAQTTGRADVAATFIDGSLAYQRATDHNQHTRT